MKLTVFNGSPRGKSSNTAILLKHFLRGFMETEGNSYELKYIVNNDERKLIEMFKDTNNVILAFPLYTACMPGVVKFFIDSLKPLCERQDNPSIGFMVQGGLPESYQSRFVERYLEKLAKRLNCQYVGCIVKGGIEGIRIMPQFTTKKYLTTFMNWEKFMEGQENLTKNCLKELPNLNSYRRGGNHFINFQS